MVRLRNASESDLDSFENCGTLVLLVGRLRVRVSCWNGIVSGTHSEFVPESSIALL